MGGWKKLLLLGAGFGAGFAIVSVALVGFWLWYSSRPKPWDAKALLARQVKAEGLSRLNDKFDEISSGVTFTVDIENATAADVTSSGSLSPRGQTRGSMALHGSFLKLPADYFLPTHQVTTIHLDADDLCAANEPPQRCFDSYFKGDQNIVIFDDVHRYQVMIPVPALTLPAGAAKTVTQDKGRYLLVVPDAAGSSAGHAGRP